MTAILGHRYSGVCFLAADSRRRDHITGDLSCVQKLHKWSDRLIFAQGGAGTGGADLVVKEMMQCRGKLGASLSSVSNFLMKEAPSLMSAAVSKWGGAGKVFHPHSVF
ncbi:MAG: hypothetical protein JKY46_02070 [Robiginitomaculum sp.]|nr:hypothetical protein [Robiginitomaculum sp.]